MKIPLPLISLVSALLLAPAPWGIALNLQTRECAGYWGGDEYVAYRLPEGWQAYYPDGGTGHIKTKIGTCDWHSFTTDEREEKCCQQLGYPYVAQNIGEKQGAPTGYTVLLLGIVVCAGGLLLAGALGALGLLAGLAGLGAYFLSGRKPSKH